MGTPFVILSAWRLEYSEEINLSRHRQLGTQLISRGFHFGVCTSFDADSGEELAYAVPLRTDAEFDNRYYLYQLARRWGQDRALLVSASGKATQVDIASDSYPGDIVGATFIGRWVQLSYQQTWSRPIWFRDMDGLYWAAEADELTKPPSVIESK